MRRQSREGARLPVGREGRRGEQLRFCNRANRVRVLDTPVESPQAVPACNDRRSLVRVARGQSEPAGARGLACASRAP